MRSRPSTVTASLAVAVTLLSAGVAHAAWSKAGTGSGATSATSLVTPELTAVRSTTSPTSAIVLSWTEGGQLAGASYEVRRNNTLITCASNPCTDSGLAADTTYSYVVTAKLGEWSKASEAVTASTQAAAVTATHYTLAATPASITAGSATSVVLTAKRPNGTIDTSYNGERTLAWSGTAYADAPGGAGVISPSTATPVVPASVTFTDGVSAQMSVTLKKAGTSLLLTATSTVAGESLAGSATVTVVPGAPARLAMTSTTTTGAGGTNVARACVFGCSITAEGEPRSLSTRVSVADQFGNIVSDLGASVTVTLAATGQGAQISAVSLTIPGSGPATSSGDPVKLTGGNANNATLTATKSVAPAYTQVSATTAKN